MFFFCFFLFFFFFFFFFTVALPTALPSLQECLDLLAGTRTSSMAVTAASAAASSANLPSRSSRFFSGSLRKPSINVEVSKDALSAVVAFSLRSCTWMH